MSDNLVQLPNKDLWRGWTVAPPPDHNVTDAPNDAPTIGLDAAMEQVRRATPRGAKELSCLWCGQQGTSAWMSEHIAKAHVSVVRPPSEAELAMAVREGK